MAATCAVRGGGNVDIEVVPIVGDDGGSVDLFHFERRELRGGALGIVQGEAEACRPLFRAWVADLDMLVDRVSLVNLDVVSELCAVGLKGVQQTRVLGLQPVDFLL